MVDGEGSDGQPGGGSTPERVIRQQTNGSQPPIDDVNQRAGASPDRVEEGPAGREPGDREDVDTVDGPPGQRRTIAINDGELGERLTGAGGAGDLRPAITPNNLASIDDAPDAPPAYLAVDLGRTRLSAGIWTTDGELVVRDRVATPQRSVWPAVTQLVDRVVAANKTEVRPRWCGVTCPGPIDQEHGIMMPVGLPVWKDFPLRDQLSRHVGLPVAIDTPGRGLGLAERWLGQAASQPASEQNYATLVIGDDVSGALIDGGELKNGMHGNLGGFGHICVDPDGPPCPCGGTGCLVMYASVPAIEADTGRDIQRTPPAIVDRAAIMVARAIASIAAMLDVSEVVVAGVVPQTFGEPFYSALDVELNDRSRLRHLEQLSIRPAAATLGPLVSAAAIARHSRMSDEQIRSEQPARVG